VTVALLTFARKTQQKWVCD